MAITDSTFSNLTGEVRIRQGSRFQDIPNLIEAGEDLEVGMFAYISDDGKFYTASQTTPATHLVIKSGEPRLTHTEIVTLTGLVQAGEPVMATTGQGTATIPIASDVVAGDELTVDANGYATRRNASQAAEVIGQALETVTVAAGNTYAWGTALIYLPARYSPAS